MVTKIPAWTKAIPKGSHGTGDLQKRLWTLTSAVARIRDWHEYDGACVAMPGVRIAHWSAGNGGHYKSYSVCNGLYKFSLENVHLQSASSNSFGGQDVGHNFGEELKRRYGNDYLEKIRDHNRDTPYKFTTKEILDLMEERISILGTLPEQPDWYTRLIKLMALEGSKMTSKPRKRSAVAKV